ncbi:4Fe-4S binding protein, partial [Streptomyces sp. GC420]|uniref:4Fe-4S binding protein n=1 Tax=Streptomyces sp. GC420 TaxID=2697568 RepID=UPI001FB66F1C
GTRLLSLPYSVPKSPGKPFESCRKGSGGPGAGPREALDRARRERSRNVLDRFAIDFSLCMYCGICIEVCPFDALFWSPEFEYAETDIRDLTHERDKLREWMWTVPEPPALDPASEEPKEIAAARKAADKIAAAEQAEQAEQAERAEQAGQAGPAGQAGRTGPGEGSGE